MRIQVATTRQEKEVLTFAYDTLKEHDLFYAGWRFEFDNAKSRVGVCKHSRKVIGISKVFLPFLTEEGVQDTILHEIAHALVGFEHGHDSVWKRKAIELGALPNTCIVKSHYADYEGFRKAMVSSSKYTVRCNHCGREKPMHRRPQRSRSCGKCMPNVYDPKYKMDIIQNY